MNLLISAMTRLVLLLVCLMGQLQAKSQLPPALSVTAELVGQGPYECSSGMEGYYVKLSVKNVSAASRQFLLYSCSWQECWFTDKPLLALWPNPCQANIVRQMSLRAGQQLDFYGFLPVLTAGKIDKLLKEKEKLPTYSTVRFAFTEVSNIANFSRPEVMAKHKAGTVYWSNTVPLTFTNNDYKVLALPVR